MQAKTQIKSLYSVQDIKSNVLRFFILSKDAAMGITYELKKAINILYFKWLLIQTKGNINRLNNHEQYNNLKCEMLQLSSYNLKYKSVPSTAR